MVRRLFLILLLLGMSFAGCAGPASSPTPSASEHAHAHEDEEEEHHHPEGVVEISQEQAQVASLQVQAVERRSLQGGLQATGTVTGDPDLAMEIAARVTGVIENLHARVGDHVSVGEVLATMDSAEVTQAQADYHRNKVEHELAVSNLQRKLRLAQLGDTVRRPKEEAEKELAAARNSNAAARAALALANARQRRTELLLADGIASQQQVDEARAQVQEARAQLDQADLDVRVSRVHLGRESRIASSGLLADTEAWEARSQEARSREALHHSRELLSLLGAGVDGEHDNLVRVTAQLSGLVTERPVARGERVEAGQKLFTILDISRLWIWIDLYEKDLASIRRGMTVRIKVPAYPKETFLARISYVSPELNAESRTVRARVEVANPDRQLKPNMFATVTVLSGASRNVPAVPATSVTRVENQDVVYVQGEGDHFVRRPVQLGAHEADWVEVSNGLKLGEKVATSGVFALKSIDLKASTEEGHSH